jgi:hypothetical protein
MQWSAIQWSRLLKLMLLGAAGFWLPDVVLHAVRRFDFSGRDVWIVTAIAPLTLLITFLLVKRVEKGSATRQVGLPLLAEVWLFGGLFMMVGASFSGGGLMNPNGIRFVLLTVLLSVIPPYTFILATYDGALYALLVVTAVGCLVWVVHRSGVLMWLNRSARKPNSL